MSSEQIERALACFQEADREFNAVNEFMPNDPRYLIGEVGKARKMNMYIARGLSFLTEVIGEMHTAQQRNTRNIRQIRGGPLMSRD